MDSKSDLWHQSAFYVHHISTPLATLQLNLQVLAEFLPTLVDHYSRSGNDGTTRPVISHETLTALQTLTEPMQHSVTTIQQQTQMFADQLQLHRPQNAPAQTTPNATPPRRIQKILVIEDEEIHQQVVVKVLSGLCDVDLASDGTEAIKKWQSQIYDAVLIDFFMPGISGPKVLEAIAESEDTHPVVIGFTNLPDIPDEYSHTAIPVSAYLKKPFNLTDFKDLLARLGLSL